MGTLEYEKFNLSSKIKLNIKTDFTVKLSRCASFALSSAMADSVNQTFSLPGFPRKLNVVDGESSRSSLYQNSTVNITISTLFNAKTFKIPYVD